MNEIVQYLTANPDTTSAISTVVGTIVASLALVVAIVSIVFTWRSLRLQDRHNQLSVQPTPYIALSRIEGLKVRLENHGFGPLKIVDIDIVGGESGKWNLVDYLPEAEPQYVDVFCVTGLKGRTISANDGINILNVRAKGPKSMSAEYLAEACKAIGALELRIKFTSVYDQEFPVYSKKLGWFLRDLG